jgi:hypothetical protein
LQGAGKPRPQSVGLFSDSHPGPGTQAIRKKENDMGQYNPYPGHGTNPELKQKQKIWQELYPGEKPMISMLINSVYYFIDCVFILQAKDNFRLVALHQGRVLCDKDYATVRGCRIAFDKMYKNKAWSEEIKAEWSHFYDPDKRWLEKKCIYLES